MKGNKVKPTNKQMATLRALKRDPKLPLAKAMREGGYGPKTALNPRQNFVDLKGTAVALDKWREVLRSEGLDEYFLIQKYKEWLDSPDYTTQLKAKDDLRRDLGLPVGNQPVTVSQLDMGGSMEINFIRDDREEIE